MLEREFKKEAEQFLIDYSSAVLSLNMAHPESESSGERVRGFENLRKNGIRRIKAIMAEFGKE